MLLHSRQQPRSPRGKAANMPLHSLGVMWAPLFSATRHGLKDDLHSLHPQQQRHYLPTLNFVPRHVFSVIRHWEVMR